MIDGKWIIWKGQLASNSERTLHGDYLTAVSEITKRITPIAAPSQGGH
jgi:hypothetical protein